ncbi:ethylene-responsive transcription factor ERF020-like [Macadamia integrifolia]|uniref:ethylene-responsive transcription factor ERF020-like n=1 Tax=Macadamia integrifolia TaxID=60698 RepID=UPI001C5320D8|nr:ethylene-responsive transcription factor ERF020-like [Macadamia integrifolia]
MNSSQEEQGSSSHGDQKRYRGVRRRKWGKWVSEIRVPGTRDRLWLGSYSTPEAAAVAYDTAMFCLRGPSSATYLNFPLCVPTIHEINMSPKSIQRVASNAAMAIDFNLANRAPEVATDDPVKEGETRVTQPEIFEDTDDIVPVMNEGSYLKEEETLNISVDDMEIYLG